MVIDHGNGEYTFIAHLKQGSVSVAAGDPIVAGTVVGQCGNSGNTSEPHLHMHLQTTGVPFEGNGLPLYFEGALVDGKEQRDVMPLKGQLAAPLR